MRNLYSRFRQTALALPHRPALWAEGHAYTYQELGRAAGAVAQAIAQADPSPGGLAALLAYRSLSAYAGVLGILAAGKGYVPLHPQFPPERSLRMLSMSGARTVVVGPEAVPALGGLLGVYPDPLNLVFLLPADIKDLAGQFPQHRFLGPLWPIADAELPPDPAVDPGAIAYLLFTSGSTGVPKGVPVSQANVDFYIDYASRRYQLNENDRVSQSFDLTFDPSVHDLFVTWSSGACLYSVPRGSLLGPAKFINTHQLTGWYSVPSVITFMSSLGMLAPGSLPSLRWSLFSGEPLTAPAAAKWQDAAPNSILENLYGPTEATINITLYRWDPAGSPAESHLGIVPIGWMFPQHEGRVVDDQGREVSDGQDGELLLRGPQVTAGYLNNPEKTAIQFVHLPGDAGGVWYRTGDLCRRRSDGCILYLGRIDHQVQIHGHRVELLEIEHIMRQGAGADLVAAIPWPQGPNVEAVYGFVAASPQPGLEEKVLACCREKLPGYMAPRKVYLMNSLPLNPNGKIDRKALAEELKERLHAAQ